MFGFIFLTFILFSLIFVFRIRPTLGIREDTSGIKQRSRFFQDAPKRYVTHTFHSGTQPHPKDWDQKFEASVAGARHCEMCLNKLLFDAIHLNRVASFPPPWLMITPEHNGGEELDHTRRWSDYFDLSDLIDKGYLIEDDNVLSHKKHGNRGEVSYEYDDGSGQVVKYYPRTQHRSDVDHSAPVIVFSHFSQDSQELISACHDISPTSAPKHISPDWNIGRRFKPSEAIIRGGHAFMRKLGLKESEYIGVHIRRGDVLHNSYRYCNFDKHQMRKMTDPSFILAALATKYPKGTTFFVCTNETDDGYRESFMNNDHEFRFVFENDTKFFDGFRDQITKMMIASQVYQKAKERVCTVDERIGNAQMFLKDFL